MDIDNEYAVQDSSAWPPKVGACYRNGWRKLWKYFLELLIIAIVSFVISLPGHGLSAAKELGGVAAVFCGILSLAFTLLLSWPISYGVSFASLKAARGDDLKVKDMFDVFQNYLNAVLANLLVAVIVGIGFFLLIVPGIIFACKLAFTPYLVVDRKMDVVEAVKESWRMTRGYTGRIFLIGLLAFPICIAGMACLVVGIIVSIMWISLAFASLYHSVSVQERHPVADNPA
jgi:uncharacterized membrane protein